MLNALSAKEAVSTQEDDSIVPLTDPANVANEAVCANEAVSARAANEAVSGTFSAYEELIANEADVAKLAVNGTLDAYDDEIASSASNECDELIADGVSNANEDDRA